MSSRTIRPRSLDVTKKLQIRRVQDVIYKEGDETFSVSSAKQGTVQKVVVDKKKTFIPTPQTRKASGLDVKKDFKQPVNYIHFTNCTGAKVITDYDQYDLLHEDVEWMNEYNKNSKDRYPLNEDAMEALIDLFEKQAWLVTKKVDPSEEYTEQQAEEDAQERLNIRPKVAIQVYNYWKNKRLKYDKALMRKFQQPPPHEDNNPHIAFRQRVPETGRRVSYRNPKKNDPSGFQKMRVLRKDFEKLIEIIDAVKERESLKRDLHLINTEVNDKKLEAVLPARVKEAAAVKPLLFSDIPKCPSQRKPIEVRNHVRKRREPSYKKHKAKVQRDKAPQSPQVAEVSDEDIFSETDDSSKEYYDNIENIIAERKMEEDGLLPRKLLPDTGFPAPHWLPDWEETLDSEIPSIQKVKNWLKEHDISVPGGDELDKPDSDKKTEAKKKDGVVPSHQSFLKHRGRFCGRIGRGGRLFLMVQVGGRGRGGRGRGGRAHGDPSGYNPEAANGFDDSEESDDF